jgi:hypothetical protein
MKGRTQRASGGGVEEGKAPSTGSLNLDAYAGGSSNVAKSAKEASKHFKKGGKVSAFIKGKMAEGMEKKMAKKDGGCATGGKAHERMDRAPRKGRAEGGPLSTANKTSERPDFKGMERIND